MGTAAVNNGAGLVCFPHTEPCIESAAPPAIGSLNLPPTQKASLNPPSTRPVGRPPVDIKQSALCDIPGLGTHRIITYHALKLLSAMDFEFPALDFAFPSVDRKDDDLPLLPYSLGGWRRRFS